MRRAVKSALWAGLLAMPWMAHADDPPTATPTAETHAASPAQPKESSSPKARATSRNPNPSKVEVSPVAITAKRDNQRLDLRLTPNRLSEVLTDSGVEPVSEEDTTIETVEVTGRQQREPIAQGIPALYYGLTHPTEAWRIFLPIQP
jgi:hypothetical protein